MTRRPGFHTGCSAFHSRAGYCHSVSSSCSSLPTLFLLLILSSSPSCCFSSRSFPSCSSFPYFLPILLFLPSSSSCLFTSSCSSCPLLLHLLCPPFLELLLLVFPLLLFFLPPSSPSSSSSSPSSSSFSSSSLLFPPFPSPPPPCLLQAPGARCSSTAVDRPQNFRLYLFLLNGLCNFLTLPQKQVKGRTRLRWGWLPI